MEIVVPAIIALFLFLCGLCVGSFLNVVICRLPRGESLSYPPSHCPRCGQTLPWKDNIPLLSWLLLRGRCRTCDTPISARYFGVELLTGLLFAAMGWSQGAVWRHSVYSFSITSDLAHALILVALLIPIFFIDQDLQIVPDELSAPLFLVGLVWNVIDGAQGHSWLVAIRAPEAPSVFNLTLPTSIVFATIAAGIFWLIQWFGEIVFKQEAMGLGDVNIAAGVGANFPLLASLCSFGIAIGVGAFYGVLVILIKGRGFQTRIAFGPMLVLGALVMLLAPDLIYKVVEWYRASLMG